MGSEGVSAMCGEPAFVSFLVTIQSLVSVFEKPARVERVLLFCFAVTWHSGCILRIKRTGTALQCAVIGCDLK